MFRLTKDEWNSLRSQIATANVIVMGGTWVCVYKNTNHVIRISTVNQNQDWQMIEHRLKEIIKEQ